MAIRRAKKHPRTDKKVDDRRGGEGHKQKFGSY